jgi:hypothetical protein
MVLGGLDADVEQARDFLGAAPFNPAIVPLIRSSASQDVMPYFSSPDIDSMETEH